MIKPFKILFWLLTATLLLSSCLKSDDDNNSTLSSDAAITNLSLGTLNRYIHTTSSTGKDSVYKTTFDGSEYKFSIDQEHHRIFNTDSLPTYTDVKHVLCTVSALNNGVVLLKSEISDTLFYFSSTDSLDFSNPRELHVMSSDGSAEQIYSLQVNVHQEEGETFVWSQHSKSNEIAALDNMKAVFLKDALYVYGVQAGKTVGYVTKDGETWTSLEEIDDAEAYQNMLVFGDAIYMIADGSLQKTNDGKTWEVIKNSVDVKQLIATSYTELYALNADNKIMVSSDEGKTWVEDELDEDASWLPVQETAYVCVPLRMTDYADYILLAGTSPAVSSISAVWRKIVEYDLQGLVDKWVYMERVDDNLLALPQLHHLQMMAYDDGVLAFGSKDGSFSSIYQTRDNGINWKKNSKYQLPKKFEGDVNSFAAATDGNEIWLLSGGTGEVWQGHLNRLAWNKKE